MTASPYIPGPWRRVKQNVIVAGEYADVGEPDLLIEVMALAETEEQEEITLQLIVAAPELYEMLEALCNARKNGSEMACLWDEAEKLLRRIRKNRRKCDA